MAYRRMVLAMSYVQERQIARTPAEVWRIATDWQVAELWLGVSKLRPTKPREAPAVGSVLSYQVRGMLHPMTIFAWEPEAHLGLSTEQGGITASYEFRFESNADGTRVVADSLQRLYVIAIGPGIPTGPGMAALVRDAAVATGLGAKPVEPAACFI